MKKGLLVALVLLMTGCMENFKKVEDRTTEERSKETVELNGTKVYTQEQIELKAYLELYLEQIKSLNTDTIIAMTYPKLFIPINRTIFKQYIETLINSSYISVKSFDTNITDIGTVHPYSQGAFAQLKYYSIIKLEFIDPELYNDELSIRVLNDVLSSKYGKENIIIEPKERTITIQKEEKLLSIKEKEKNWKFIGDNQEYRRLYPEILPLDILSKI